MNLFVLCMFPLSPSAYVCVQVLSSQFWRSCCLSLQSRTIPAGWSSRQHTAVPTKCGSWCRSILTRLVQHSFSLLQSTACSKSSFHQDTKTGGGEFKGQRLSVPNKAKNTLYTSICQSVWCRIIHIFTTHSRTIYFVLFCYNPVGKHGTEPFFFPPFLPANIFIVNMLLFQLLGTWVTPIL